jgi:hypothetical protein
MIGAQVDSSIKNGTANRVQFPTQVVSKMFWTLLGARTEGGWGLGRQMYVLGGIR